jgi:hypothetical protein
MTRYFPATHDPVLKHLFQCSMSDEQIAERIGVSWQTIRRHRERLGLGYPTIVSQVKNEEVIPPRTFDPNNPMVVAFNTLGPRLTEMKGTYRLDGTPTRFFDLMRETNRELAKQGKSQVGPNEWRVMP